MRHGKSGRERRTYVLALNGIVAKDAVMTDETLKEVEMPNRSGFVSKWSGHKH